MNSIKTAQAIVILCSLTIMNIRGAEELKTEPKVVSTPSSREADRKLMPPPPPKRPSNKRLAIKKAQTYLDIVSGKCQRAKDRVTKNFTIKKGDKYTAVFDVENTALATMEDWRSEDALPLPPVLDLYNFLLEKGVKVVFITERARISKGDSNPDDPMMLLTQEQLKNAGYGDDTDVSIMSGVYPYGIYKYNTRIDVSDDGQILLNIGSNGYDFENNHGNKEENEKATAVLEVHLPQPPPGLDKDILRELIEAQLKSEGATANLPLLPQVSLSSSPALGGVGPVLRSSLSGVGSSSSSPLSTPPLTSLSSSSSSSLPTLVSLPPPPPALRSSLPSADSAPESGVGPSSSSPVLRSSSSLQSEVGPPSAQP